MKIINVKIKIDMIKNIKNDDLVFFKIKIDDGHVEDHILTRSDFFELNKMFNNIKNVKVNIFAENEDIEKLFDFDFDDEE